METVGKVYFLARLGVEEINGSGILLYLQQLEVGDTHAAVLRAFVQSLAVVGRDGEAYVAECLVGVDARGKFFCHRTTVCEVDVCVGVGEGFPRHAVSRYLDTKRRRMQLLAEIAYVQVCGRILLFVSGCVHHYILVCREFKALSEVYLQILRILACAFGVRNPVRIIHGTVRIVDQCRKVGIACVAIVGSVMGVGVQLGGVCNQNLGKWRHGRFGRVGGAAVLGPGRLKACRGNGCRKKRRLH